jgi:hypothetical protein
MKITVNANVNDSVAFEINQVVRFRLNDELCGIVVGIVFRAAGVSYLINRSDLETSEHVAAELEPKEDLETA